MNYYYLHLTPIIHPLPEETRTRTDNNNNDTSSEMETADPESGTDAMGTAGAQPEDRHNEFFPFGDPTSWELPFLQGWLIGQSQAEKRMMRPISTSVQENPPASGEPSNQDPAAASAMPTAAATYSRGNGRYISRIWASRSRANHSTGEGAGLNGAPNEQSDPQPVVSKIHSELATSLAAAAAAELPCTVKLRIWPHDIKVPCAALEADKCRHPTCCALQ